MHQCYNLLAGKRLSSVTPTPIPIPPPDALYEIKKHKRSKNERFLITTRQNNVFSLFRFILYQPFFLHSPPFALPPGQILCLAEMVRFTENCEEALKRGSLRQCLQEVQAQLEGYTGVDLGGAAGSGAVVLELKLKALILDTIHNMDVVQFLMDTGARSPTDWMWQKQLRYRHLTEHEIFIRGGILPHLREFPWNIN